MNDSLPLYMTPPEAAEVLRVKPERIRQWIERGELIAANLSDKSRPRYRIARADFLAFLDRRAATPQPTKPKRRKRQIDAGFIKRY